MKTRIIRLPADVEAATGVVAIAPSAQSIRIQLRLRNPGVTGLPSHTCTVGRHTTAFPYTAMLRRDTMTPDELVALADWCRVAAYRHGRACQRDLVS